MQGGLTARRRTALCLALASFAFPSNALELGPAEVASGLGEKLDARIPLRVREGEWFHAKCLALAPAPSVAPFPADSTLSVERRRSGTHLRVRSANPVNEPAIAFGISSACDGAARLLGEPVTLLIDPPRVARRTQPAPVPASQVARATPRPADAAPAPRQPAPPAAPARPAPPAPQSKPGAAASTPATADAATSVALGAGPGTTEAPPPRTRRPGEFVLKLSSGDLDVARTRQFDESSRARLRERLRLLDSDDQVAEMLSMRDNLRRLEARVAELQLKLAAMPQSFPAAPAAAEPPKAAPPAPVAAEATPAAPVASEAPKAAAPVVTAQAPAAAPAPSAPPTPAKAATPASRKPAVTAGDVVGAVESFEGRLIAVLVLILVLLGLLGGLLWSRLRGARARKADPVLEEAEATELMLPDEDVPRLQDPPIEIATPARPEVTSDAALATRLEEDTEALRRRYIQERFPEIRAGTIVLDDPASVVKGARLFYEDGALPRAVELLRFAVEDRPGEVRPWLALFEIYRLERLSGEYAELAARFREVHGDSPQWAKVRSFGHELDPGNELFREPPMNSLETIGPREARRIAASRADPMVENWLDAPMDFENEVLATELRRSLMARAKVEDGDLVPNPMPALRRVEMFPVG